MSRAAEAEANRDAGKIFPWPDGKFRYIEPPAPGTVFTAGYGNAHKAVDLFKSVRAVDGVLLDIRTTPYSKGRPEWSSDGAKGLSALFQCRYRHVWQLGNRNYRTPERGIEIADFEAGMREVAAVLLKGQSPVLLCGCTDYQTCHRRDVAEELAASGHETQELHWLYAFTGEVPCL